MPCPRLRSCRSTCLHRQSVEAYYALRDWWEARMEQECIGYAAEEAEFTEREPRPTFKGWLTQGRR